MRLNSFYALLVVGVLTIPAAARAQSTQVAEPQQGDFVIKDFRFHTGEMLPELRLHYMTLGAPAGEPVLVLHGSSGSGQSMMAKSFAGELFGAGQPLDAAKYFIIIPDAIGSGKSSRPADGLHARFPKYSYEDMVVAQHRLVTEHLGLHHLKLVIGQSMGGMHAWMWGEMYPDFVSVLIPMASQPTAMSGRNWMLRRMLIEMIRSDPAYNNGDYTEQPPSFRLAANFFSMATSGGTRALYAAATTRAQADQVVQKRLSARFNADANDYIYSYEAARDYDPSPDLEKIKARVLAINSADDERNPIELGILDREIKRVKNGSYYQIPASAETRGHGTSGDAKWWKHLLPALLNEASTPGQ
jgi:homoserine O-acetyltransferase/O-succinyltransferase